MATLALAGLGAAAGGMLTGGAAYGVQGGFLLGQVAARALGLGATTETREGPRVSEFRVTGSAFGEDLPTVDGSFRVEGKLIDLLQVREVKHEQEIGGKGAPSQSVTGFSYLASFAVAFCEAPAAGIDILKLFVGVGQDVEMDLTAGTAPVVSPELVRGAYRALDPGFFSEAPSAARQIGPVRLYRGTHDQPADPLIQAIRGIDEAPAYRGVCYALFEDYPLEGAQLPPVSALVTDSASAERTSVVVPQIPGASLDLRRALYAPDGRSFWTFTSTGSLHKWDAVNRRPLLIATPPEGSDNNSGETFAVHPDDGTIFMGWHGPDSGNPPGTSRSLCQYNDRGHKIAHSEGAVVPGGNLQQFMVGGLFPNRRLLTFTEGRYMAVTEAEAGGRTIDKGDGAGELPILELVAQIDLEDFYAASGFLREDQGVAVDGEGHVWSRHRDDVSAFLVRVDVLAGELVEIVFNTNGGAGLAYVPEIDALAWLVSGSNPARFALLDLETRSEETFTVPVSIGGSYQPWWSAFRNGPVAGRMWFENAPYWRHEVDFINRRLVRSIDLRDWGLTSTALQGTLYDPVGHAVIAQKLVAGDGDDLEWAFLDRLSPGETTLGAIIERHSERVGLSKTTDVDAANLTDAVKGFTIPRRTQVKQPLEALQLPYFFEAVEEHRGDGYKVRFVKRGSTPVTTIPLSELGARPSGAARRPPLRIGRGDERKLPQLLELAYADPTIDYQPNLQSDRRVAEATESREQVKLDLQALALESDEAARIVERALFLAWVNRTPFDFSLTRKHSRLSPADVIRVDAENATYTVRIRTIRRTRDGVLLVNAVAEEASVYASAALGAAADGVPAKGVKVLEPAEIFVLDIPSLSDRADGLHLTLAAGAIGDQPGWPGATIERSVDGVDFAPYAFISPSANVAHGFALEALPAFPDSGRFDRTSTLKVQVLSGLSTLASITEDALLADLSKNGFILQSGSAWEIGNFVDLSLQADDTVHLTTLLRGQRNTETHTAGHKAGDLVVFPTRSTIGLGDLALGDLGVARFYRGTTVGLPLRDAIKKTVSAVGRSRLPYSPHFLGWTTSGGDYTARAVRRTRLGGLVTDFGDVYLAEQSENFEADLIDDSGAVALTITTSPSPGGSKVTINPQDFEVLVKAADLAGISVPFTLKIYQVGGMDGATRGEPLTVVIG